MKSRPVGTNQDILASHQNDKRDDARASGFLLAHQQLGALALGTNPTNGQTVTFDVNGTNIIATFVSAIGSTANNILIGATAVASIQNLLNWLRRPDITNSNQVAASGANQTLLSYVGFAWPGSGTTIVPFSLNKNVNGIVGVLTSFNITTTVTSGTWTAQTMQLYVEDGTYYIGTTRVLFTGGSTLTFTAPSSHPRIDLITADSSGTIALVTGTENASPSAPSYPANKIVICEVYHVVGETAIYDNEDQQSGEGYIYNDVRPTLGGNYISSSSQVASGLFIPDPGSEAQGDVLYYNGSAWVLLTPGTAGSVLTTAGPSANPSWVLATPKNLGFITPGTNQTGITVSTFTVVASVANIPALATNQTILLRLSINVSGTVNGRTLVVGAQQGTNNLAIITGTGNNGTENFYQDLWITATTPASAQTYFGYQANNTTAPSFTQGSLSCDFSSPWLLNVGASQNGSGFTMGITINFCALYIFN